MITFVSETTSFISITIFIFYIFRQSPFLSFDNFVFFVVKISPSSFKISPSILNLWSIDLLVGIKLRNYKKNLNIGIFVDTAATTNEIGLSEAYINNIGSTN